MFLSCRNLIVDQMISIKSLYKRTGKIDKCAFPFIIYHIGFDKLVLLE